MAEDDEEQQPEATIRRIINTLLDLADELPQGADTPVKLGICDGTDLRIAGHVDAAACSVLPGNPDGTAKGPVVLIRAHDHGTSRGHLMRGIAADADAELRRLTGQDPPDIPGEGGCP